MKKSFADFYDEMMIYVDYDGWAKLIYDKLNKLLGGKKILEIGCGTGEISKRLTQYGYEVSGIDNSESMLSVAKKKYNYLSLEKKDMRSLEIENEYDGIVCGFGALNDLENLAELERLWEFFEFGIGDENLFGISVSHNRGTKNLFEWIYQHLPVNLETVAREEAEAIKKEKLS